MFVSFVIAILFGAAPADETTVSSVPLTISFGDFSFAGDTVKLTKSRNGAFECEIEGNAQVAVVHSGVSVTAHSINIQRDANSQITIRCANDCRFTDSGATCTADRIQIHLAKEATLHLSGSSRVECRTGAERTVIESETISIENGKFSVPGANSLQGAH